MIDGAHLVFQALYFKGSSLLGKVCVCVCVSVIHINTCDLLNLIGPQLVLIAYFFNVAFEYSFP